MKTQNLKNVIEVLTAFIYFCGFMTVAALDRPPAFHGWECLKISFKLDACPLM